MGIIIDSLVLGWPRYGKSAAKIRQLNSVDMNSYDIVTLDEFTDTLSQASVYLPTSNLLFRMREGDLRPSFESTVMNYHCDSLFFHNRYIYIK